MTASPSLIARVESAPPDMERDELAMIAVAAWLNVTPEQVPEKYRVHTCQASMEAWARVGEAIAARIKQEMG